MHGPDGVLAVTDVLLLAATTTGAGSLEGPREAYLLASMLRYLDLMALGHCRDGGRTMSGKAVTQVAIHMGIDDNREAISVGVVVVPRVGAG